MFTIRSGDPFTKTESYLRALMGIDIASVLEANAQKGVDALARAVPKESGLAANSWTYVVEETATSCTIKWQNKNIEEGFPVAIMLQYGYATGTGGYVAGRDYINPAMRPIFDQIESDIRKAVTSIR